MKNANMVYDEDDITDKIQECRLGHLGSILTELAENYPPEAYFNLETYESYGSTFCRALVCYERPETAQEVAKKELLKRQQYVRSRQLYEQLKKEFGE